MTQNVFQQSFILQILYQNIQLHLSKNNLLCSMQGLRE